MITERTVYMKKIIAFITLAMSVMITAVSAQEAVLTVNEPVVDGAVINYSGSLENGVTDYISFYVTNSGGEYYHIGKTQANSETGEFFGSFKLGDNVPSGNYEIVFGGVKMDKSVTKEFTFYSKSDRSSLIAAMTDANKNTEEIVSLAITPKNIEILKAMQCDTEGFLGLGDYQSAAAELIKSRQNGYYDSDFTEEKFKEMFNFTVAFIATVKAPQSDLAAKLKEYKDIFGIDTEGLENSAYLTEKMSAVQAGSPESFKTVYNSARAVIAINDELDYKNVKNVLEKYYDVYKLDLSFYTKLSDYKMSEVYQDLISRDYSSPEAVVTAFNSKYNALCNENNKGSSSGGSSGGGGGGGYGYMPPQEQTPVETAPSKNENAVFNDLSGYEWAEPAIKALSENKVIDGTGNNRFEPATSVKREQFVKMIVAGFALANSGAECDFNDVQSDAWYYMYVASAVKSGIINGKDNGLFGTGDDITREDMAVILYRLVSAVSIDLPSGEIHEFADSESISEYAKEAVEKLSSAGIINGRDDNSFGAKDNATRAEAAKLIYEIWKLKY